VYTVHGLSRWSSGETVRKGGFHFDETVLGSAAGIVSISREYADFITKTKLGKTVVAIGNGIDVEKFRPRNSQAERNEVLNELGMDGDDIIFLYVGNMYLPEKVEGIRDLINALHEVKDQFEKHASLLLVGDGVSRPELETLVQEKGLAANVRFLGLRRDVPHLLRASDVFILPSRHEGSPNALLEAMATGLTCIGMDVGGIPDIIGKAGILSPVADIKALASSIARVIAEKDLREQLGTKARERAVNELSWESAAQRLNEFYGQILSKCVS
jgi:glycosyltransferase involved in cell wall biosynthesis